MPAVTDPPSVIAMTTSVLEDPSGAVASANLTAVASANLTKTYGAGPTAVTALDDVNVAFRRGEFTAIMGPSGSGKSTLMHCLATLDTPSSGFLNRPGSGS